MFTPYRLRDMAVQNRVVVSPMCMYSSEDGLPNDWHLVHLGSRAIGGAALVMTEMTDIAPEARITPGCAGMWSEAHAQAWKRVVDFVHGTGTAKIGIQLAHAGRKGATKLLWEGIDEPLEQGAWPIVAPSPVPYYPHSQVPRAMTRADMDRVRDDFVRAARYADEAGFDMIELHMAHGYLLHSFVSPISNKRNDAYGGSLEGRMKFPLEVLRAVRAVLPKGMPLGARISATDWMDGGLTGDDSVLWVKAMKEAGLDFVCISSGGVTAEVRTPTTPGYNVPIAEQVRRETGIATRAVGLIATARQAEAIIAEGKADMIALGRAMLEDPHWAWMAAKELGADVARPNQYLRAAPKMWPGAAYRDNAA
jgi:anthraniloyl-CoA monooxygenase